MMFMGVEMDIKKVREAFEKLPEIRDSLSEHIVFIGSKYTTSNPDFYDLVNWLNGAWYAWKAKAQAVPEGFVLVPIKPSEDVIDKIASVICDEFDTTISGSAHCASEAYKTMVGESK